MKLISFEKLCCPLDKHDLQLQIITESAGHVVEGMLTCSHCKRRYPVIHGVPVMSPDEYRDFSLEQPVTDRWEKALAQAEIRLLGHQDF